jgi:arsenate reductase
MKQRVLFICVHNSARSQMAEEFLRMYAGDRFEVESAGLEPGEVNPLVAEVMREEGVEIAGKETHSVFDFYKEGRRYDWVIAVCSREAEERCPVFPGLGSTKRLHWPFEDPSQARGSHEEKLVLVRGIREQIRQRVLQFVRDTSVEGTA